MIAPAEPDQRMRSDRSWPQTVFENLYKIKLAKSLASAEGRARYHELLWD